ncbi:MAG: AAA family ATPase [Marinospirillum sp.]|uniref:AAA family ATPase n=1 Tax=Marinospirillum sp. TaxID=2183934 RepID=UPI001A00CD66|nr:AAA family ATPase [Marinospirillum sp.]MBE0508986.1 AAA family ATPase [Marinospirillum sp.]
MDSPYLKTLSLDNFTLFDKAQLDFSPGINVFLGQNASGKTHLLKLLYSVSRAVTTAKDLDTSKAGFAMHLSKRLIRNFQVEKIGRLASRVHGHKHCNVEVKGEGAAISFDFSTRDQEIALGSWNIKRPQWPDPVYLPTKEILSMFHGLVSAMAENGLELEELYSDLALKLGTRSGTGPKVEWQKNLMEPLEKMLKAAVIYDEKQQRFYIKQRGIGKLEAGLAAEGYRKIGMLLQLVANRSLAENSALFWDEPEVNVNPSFAEPLAGLIRAFSEQKTQVFIATHDYFVLKYLHLLASEKNTPIQFFSLYREKSTDKFVKVEAARNLYELEHNPVLEEFDKLYQSELNNFYGKR